MQDNDAPQEIAEQQETPTPAVETGERTFTQAEVDRIVGERAKRAEDAAVKRILEAVGVDSLDALKSTVGAVRQQQQTEMSEAERMQTQLDELARKAAEAEQRAVEAEQRRLADKRQSAVRAALRDAEHPEDVLLWINAHASERYAAVLGEAEAVDEKAVGELIAHVRDQRPNFFRAAGPGSPSTSGGKNPRVNPDEIMSRLPRLRL